MNLSESYKKRLKVLAGLLKEDVYDFSDEEKNAAFQNSNEKTSFNKDLMIKAIKEGWEIGILFKSNNDKYQMPIFKERIIYPVAMGVTKKGNPAIRAFHKLGQSESAARATKKRSQEVKDEWRLFKLSGIKKMWFTGRFFQLEYLSGYKEIGDKGLSIVEVQSKKSEVRKFQKSYNQNLQNKDKPRQETVIVKNEPKIVKDPQVIKKPEEKIKPEPKTVKDQLKTPVTIAPKTVKDPVKKTASPISKEMPSNSDSNNADDQQK